MEINYLTNEQFQQANYKYCSNCKKSFHTFRRRHRCKCCGEAVCNNCSKNERAIDSPFDTSTRPLRVCNKCAYRLQNDVLNSFEPWERPSRDTNHANAQVELLPPPSENPSLPELNELESGLNAQEESVLNTQEEIENAQEEEIKNGIVLDEEDIDNLFPRNYNQIKRSSSHLVMKNDDDLVYIEKVLQNVTIMKAPCVEECSICFEYLQASAIFTTSCNHRFHYQCIVLNMEKSNECPICRKEISEIKSKQECKHPRIRNTHRYCRDCGKQVQNIPANQNSNLGNSANHNSSQGNRANQNPRNTIANQNSTFRAGQHGAVVRCPVCQIRIRVLPNMYNMRVACPAGHQFQVSLSNR